MLDPCTWTEILLRQYGADMRQLAGPRDIPLNGMRALHLHNAAGQPIPGSHLNDFARHKE